MIRSLACCLLAALTFNGSASAASRLPGPYSALVERVVDGDTLGVRVTIWLGQELDVLVRIRGIDAPELHGRCESETARARAAAAALQRLVSGGTVVLTGIGGGKYFGRVVAKVATPDGVDVGEALVAGGHARRYDGGARRSWCEIGRQESEGANLARAELSASRVRVF